MDELPWIRNNVSSLSIYEKVSFFLKKLWSDCGMPSTKTMTLMENYEADGGGGRQTFAPKSVPRPDVLFHCNSHLGRDSTEWDRKFETNFRMEYAGSISPPSDLPR